jgi:hypothetical protein
MKVDLTGGNRENRGHNRLLSAIENMTQFAEQVAAKDQAKAFQKLQDNLRTEQRLSEGLKEDIFKARGLAAFWIPSHISRQRWAGSKKEQLKREFSVLNQALVDALMPPKAAAFPETEVQRLAGNDEYTTVFGNTKDAKRIATKAMRVVGSFSEAVFKEDLQTAYSLCANELRTWMSVKRFWTELAKADRRYGGRPVACKSERVSCIWADAVSRQKTPNTDSGWPKDTPKPNKRATVGAFWFTNPVENVGRWIFFWITEEAEGYRIAKFNQYLQ